MSAAYDLAVERLIDAPLAAVWRAWLEHDDEWFCPRPWTSHTIVRDLSPGGAYQILMRGPEGEEHRVDGVFLEVVPQRRIVSTDAFTAGWVPNDPFLVRIESFADAGDGRTRYTATARHWSAEACEKHRAMGFEAGWGAAADQLAEVARRIA